MSRTNAIRIPSIALAAVAAGFVASGSGMAAPTPTSYTPARLPDAPVLSIPAAIDAVKGGLPDVVSAAIGAPLPVAPDQVGPVARPTTVDVVVKTPATGDGTDLLAQWEADELVGAVADLSGRQAATSDTAIGRLIEALPSGARTEGVPLGAGYVASRQAFTDEAPAETIARLEAVATRYGVGVVSVTAAKGISTAPIVRLQVTSPAAEGQDFRPMIADMFGSPGVPTYEGYYLEVQDSSGQPFFRNSAAFRGGAGRLWTAPGVPLGNFGLTHGGPPPGASELSAAVGAVRAAGRNGLIGFFVTKLYVGGPSTVKMTAVRRGKQIAVGTARFGPAGGWHRVTLHVRRGTPMALRRAEGAVTLLIRGRDSRKRLFGAEFTLTRIPLTPGARPPR